MKGQGLKSRAEHSLRGRHRIDVMRLPADEGDPGSRNGNADKHKRDQSTPLPPLRQSGLMSLALRTDSWFALRPHHRPFTPPIGIGTGTGLL